MGKLLCCIRNKNKVNQLSKREEDDQSVQLQSILFAQRTNTQSQTLLFQSTTPTNCQNKVRHKVRETTVIFNRSAKEINEYIIGETIGKGSFGKVKVITRQGPLDSQEKFAVKIFRKKVLRRKKEFYKNKNGVIKQRNALDDVLKEIAVMKKLDHENVIKLVEVINDETADKLFMVMEYAEKGQLIEWDSDNCNFYYSDPNMQGFLSEDRLRQIFRQCVKGLYYLHENGIIHRDFKPQNILFDTKDNIKIGDFGVAVLFEPETKQQIEFPSENEQNTPQTNDYKKQLTRKPTMQIEYTPIAGTYFFMSPECQDSKLKQIGDKSIRGKPIDI